MAENVRVIVRCRPTNRKEQEMKYKDIVRIEDCAVHLAHNTDTTAPPKTFTFDAAYAGTTGTEAIYNDLCYALVDNVLDGYNGTIFAYGQTGCGKSHTMQGPDVPGTTTVPSEQRGIIQRAFEHIFEAISVARGRRYLAQCSYLEIYNENIRDLLEPTTASSLLQLKEQASGDGITVSNLSMHTVHTAAECERLLAAGARNRIVAATLMNATSSRSHSIFTISLEQIAMGDGDAAAAAGGDAGVIRTGKLNLVDLAGSERQAKTGAAGDRLKEATKINLSLSALGNVISALVDGRRSKHVPYRDSRLTRLLQDSLGGNTKTLMVACVSPAAYNYDETLSTLRYASRAKCISNKPRINEDPKDAALREYQAEISKLRQLLAEGNGAVGQPEQQRHAADPEQLARERDELRDRYESDAARLRQEFAREQRAKEELREDMLKLREHYEQEMRALAAEAERAAQQQKMPIAEITGAATTTTVQPDANNNNNSKSTSEERQAAAVEVHAKVEEMRGALIGGERADDVQLRERHKRKKAAAERRMSALANALARMEQSEERDLLHTHYTDISAELQAKTDALRQHRQRVRALEREVSDVQAEFELDRADYLETIRRLQRRVRFYEQMTEKALPLLRRDGRFWDPAAIRAASTWNDDLGRWRIPEYVWGRVRLPPAGPSNGSMPTSPLASTCTSADTVFDEARNDDGQDASFPLEHGVEDDVSSPVIETTQKLHNADDIAGSYFRPRGGTRAAVLLGQPRVMKAAWQTAGLTATGLTNPASPKNSGGSAVAMGGNFVNAVRRATQHAQNQQRKQSLVLVPTTLNRTWGAPSIGMAVASQFGGANLAESLNSQQLQSTSPTQVPEPITNSSSSHSPEMRSQQSHGRIARPQAASTRGQRPRNFVT